jgi:hypothetical protein
MPDPTLIGLGFQGNANNRFQSANPNLAPGSSNFYACVLVNIQESLLVAPVQASYFGNFNAAIPPNSFGWEIGRGADTPASDPPNSPEVITLRVRFGHGVSATTLSYSVDAMSMFGRTHLIGFSVIGLVATLYVNGAAVAQDTFVGAFNLGGSGLTYGNIAGGGSRSGDPVISAAYSDSDAANFIALQRALFEGVRTSGKLAATISVLGLSAGYIYESFQQKAPISGVPTTPLKNFGIAGVNGNLIFAGSVALVLNADPDPDYTGGSQSSTVGPGSVNLQDAYDAGPTGLIVLGANGPVGVDELRFQTGGEITVTPGSSLNINTPNGTSGTVLIQTGDGIGVSSGTLTLATGGSDVDIAGDLIFIGGAGGSLAGSGLSGSNFIGTAGVGGNAIAGGLGGVGGQILFTAGNGGDATGVGATAGQGGEINFEAGGAGIAAGGALEGPGGRASLSGGIGGAGIGGDARLVGGNGDTASGGVEIFAGTSDGNVGLVSISGGAASGIAAVPGGTVNIAGGASSNGASSDGGTVNIDGGLGDLTPGVGGAVNITGGTTRVSGGPGGPVSLIAGAGGGGILDNGGFGGEVIVRGGGATQENQPAGDGRIEGGNATGAGAPARGGNVQVRGGNSTASTGGALLATSGAGATAADAGPLQASFASSSGGATATIGGFHLEPADGRLSLRTYTVGGVDTGSLRLHQLDNAAEAAQSVDDGLLHYSDEQAAGVAVTVGFHAAKSGDYGLMGRCYSRTFVAADTPGDVLTVTHNLDSEVVQYAVYDPAGVKAFEVATQIVGVVAASDDVLEISFNSGFITAGTWRVAVFGY